MKSILGLSLIAFLMTSCWPSKISFIDKGSMHECLEQFSMPILENNAPNAPANYATELTEEIKNGIQNNTRLALVDVDQTAQVQLEGEITSYTITPIALQEGDNAEKNRLTIAARIQIYYTCPEDNYEEEMQVVSTRFSDFDASQDINSVEATLLEEINQQIVQDVINKLLSNW